jgi:multimeric flavodoxin WrbA
MNLLIHDLSPEEWEKIASGYEGWNVVRGDGSARPCIGCFHCWTGGSGECIFRDGYHRMCALIHEADEMVISSRYTYGGFSSGVKSVFDRCIGYVLPEFETAYGEMHHQRRFPGDKPVTFIFRGTALSESDKEKAREYAAAVCRNLRGIVKDVIFEECPQEEKKETPARGAEKRSGILMINCSLRREGSNTGVFLKKLQECMEAPAETVSLSIGDIPDELIEAVRRAGTIILGAPLYVDGLPAYALKLLDALKATGAAAGCRLYALVNNGLYESKQNVNMIGVIKDFCAGNGIKYEGTAAIGAGELVGTLMRSGRLWPVRNAEQCIGRLAKAIDTGSELGEIYADPFLFPRALYIGIANTNWQRLKRKERKRGEGKKR